MSVVNLHPEDLYDKEARGEATPEELARIANHVAECPTCRLERALKSDFAADLLADEEEAGGTDHPEELFDKETRGVASADELARIATHIASCASCRFERTVKNDFAADLLLDDDADDGVRLTPIVGSLTAHAPNVVPFRRIVSGESDDDVVPVRTTPSRRPRRRLAWVLAAAALLAAGAAGATGLRHVLSASNEEADAVLVSPSAKESTGSTAHGGRPSTTAAPAEIASAAGVRDDVDVDAAADDPSARAVAAPLVTASNTTTTPARPSTFTAPPSSLGTTPIGPTAGATASVSTLASAAALLPPPPPPETPVSAPIVPETSVRAEKIDTAGDLFARAGVARQQGDVAGALRIYAALQTSFPKSREARASYVITGRVQLDRGNPAAALASFEGYLRTGAQELREEGLVGRAQSLERLGRFADEGRAWEQLLAERPGTGYGEHARARLAKLGTP